MSAIIKSIVVLVAAYFTFSQGNIAMRRLTYDFKIHVFETIVRFNKSTRMESMSRKLTGYPKQQKTIRR